MTLLQPVTEAMFWLLAQTFRCNQVAPGVKMCQAGSTVYPMVSTTDFNTFMQTLLAPLIEFLVGVFGGPARTYPLDIIRVLIVVPVFLYASYRDIQERIVRDHVWVPIYVFGLLFLVYDLWVNNLDFLAPYMAGNILFAVVLGYVLYWTELFGGADRKALIGLALLFPTYPMLITFPLVMPPVLNPPMNAANMFSLTIMANTAIVAAFYPFTTALRNAREGRFDPTRPGLMLTATRVPLDEVPNRHGKVLATWTFQSDDAIGRFVALVKTVVYGIDTSFLREYLDWHNDGSDDDIDALSDLNRVYLERFLESDANDRWEEARIDLDEAQASLDALLEQDEVWMTPGIPFIVPMTVGLLLSLFVGDIVYWLVVALN